MSFDLDRIRKSARSVSKYVKRNAKRPSADAVHKLRTGARHLETAVVALELGSKGLLRDLDKIKKLSGKLRDMDVLTADLLKIDRRGEEDCLVRLAEHLGARRSARARKLRAGIAKRRKRIRRALERGVKRAEKAAADAAPRAAAQAMQSSRALGHPGRLTRKNLHEYRLKVKELRDILRFADQPDHAKLVKDLGEVKDAIGDWHDWDELTDIAADVLDHGKACELPKRLASTRDAKYRHALSLAHALVHRLRPGAKPVLEAVAAITEP